MPNIGELLKATARGIGKLPRLIGDQFAVDPEAMPMPSGYPGGFTPPFNPNAGTGIPTLDDMTQMGVEGEFVQNPRAVRQVDGMMMPRRKRRGLRLIGDLVGGAMDGLATPNVAMGGPVDMARAFQSGRDGARGRAMQDFTIRRQGLMDAYNLSKDAREWNRLDEVQRHNRQVELNQAERNAVMEQNRLVETVRNAMKEGARIVAPDEPLTPEQVSRVQQVGPMRILYPTKEEMARGEANLAIGLRRDQASQLGLKEDSPEYQRFVLTGQMSTQPTPKNLAVDNFTDETTGDVTRVFSDPVTGQEVRRETLRGVAKKRPPVPSLSATMPGTWTAEVDAGGNIVGYRNNKTLEFQTPPDSGNRRTGVSSGERKDLASAEVAVANLNKLEELAGKLKSSIGPAAGRITAFRRDFTGGSSPEENELFQVSGMVADDLLRMKSGAQINEQEMARLQKLVPLPTQPYNTFMSNLNALRREIGMIRSARPSGSLPANQGGTGGQQQDTVVVIAPNGVRGTMPRESWERRKADLMKKQYRLAQ